MDNNSCPGVPDKCEHSQAVISKLLEGMPGVDEVGAARNKLAHCLPCLQKVDFQYRFKLAMSQYASEEAPLSLQLRITEALGRVDLSGIEVTDL